MKRSPANRLSSFLRDVRKKGQTLVFTNGCFDVLHAGHVRYLAKARRLGDVLLIGLNSDASVRRLKGPGRPVNSQKDRQEVLEALSSVDFVQVFSEPTPEKLIRKVCPDVLVKGGDWKIQKIVGYDFVRARGGKVLTLPFVKGRSTTQTLKRIQSLG